jgi:alpha-1,2-mannosyltransferase
MTTYEVSARSRRGRVAVTGLLVSAAAVLVLSAALAVFSSTSDEIGWDYRTGYLPAATAVRHGESPYPDPDDPALDLRRAYVYPPQVAIALVPLTEVPSDLGTFIVFLLSLAALCGAIALVGVRDVRCYAALLMWAPTWNSLITLNVSSALALGVAALWRFRATLWPLALTLGALVSIKLFLAPLVAWVALTRRANAAALGLCVALGLTIAAWAAIGFAGLADYLDLLSRVEKQQTYALSSAAAELGVDARLARAFGLAVGVGLVALAASWTRRGDGERGYAAAVAATIAMSPVVWLHYLTLLIAPLGVLRPRFSPLWLVPIVLWVSPRDENGDGLQPFVPALVVALLLIVMLIRRPSSPSAATARSV